MAHGSRMVVLRALLANVLIATAKFVAGIITMSAAMLAEAVHSLADSSNQYLLLLGLNKAKRAEDRRHEFGYAPERYFWSFIVAVMLFGMGATFSVYEGVHKVLHADTAQIKGAMVAYIVLGVSLLLESWSMKAAIEEFQHFRAGRTIRQALKDSRDSSVLVILFEDGAALVGLVLALLGIFLADVTGSAIFDGLASIAVGILLAGVSVFLAVRVKAMLIGEAVTVAQRDEIVAITAAMPGVHKVIHLRTMHLGPDDVICAMKVAFADTATTKELATLVDQIEERLRAKFAHLTRIYIEVGTEDAPLQQRTPRTTSHLIQVPDEAPPGAGAGE